MTKRNLWTKIISILCLCIIIGSHPVLNVMALETDETGGLYSKDTGKTYYFDEISEYKKITLEDFGFKGATTITGDEIVKFLSNDSLHGVELEGIFNFSIGIEQNFLLIGGEGMGLWLIPQEDGVLRFAHVDADEDHHHPVDCNKYWTITDGDLRVAGIRNVSLTGSDFKLNLKFQFEKPNAKISALKVVVTINDTVEDFFVIDDVPVDTMKQTIHAKAKAPMTLTAGEYKAPVTLTDEVETMEEKVNWDMIIIGIAGGTMVILVGCGVCVTLMNSRKKKERK